MKAYFLFVDYFLPLFFLFLVFRKRTLSVVYIPFFYFASFVVEMSNHFALYQLITVMVIVYYIVFHLPFIKRNIFWVFLFLYFVFLLSTIRDFKEDRPHILSLFLILTLVPLVPEIFKNYSKSVVFDEIAKSAGMILGVFIFNTVISSALKYFPPNEYGFTSGVSFGHLGINTYSVLPLILFIVLKKAIKDKSLLYFLLYFGGILLVMLTLRRTAMLLSVVGSIFVVLEMFNLKQIKDLALYGFIALIFGFGVLKFSGFADQLIERVEQRNLAERELSSEKRFLEFEIIYNDLFVLYDYDPWFGYGLFNSKGNYGRKVFGTRSLHTDFAYYVHAGGFLFLTLYLCMMGKAFWDTWIKTRSREDRFRFLFLILYFSVLFMLGNSRNPIHPSMFICLLSIPFANDVRSTKRKIIYDHKLVH
jgi:hypothetical protein